MGIGTKDSGGSCCAANSSLAAFIAEDSTDLFEILDLWVKAPLSALESAILVLGHR